MFLSSKCMPTYLNKWGISVKLSSSMTASFPVGSMTAQNADASDEECWAWLGTYQHLSRCISKGLAQNLPSLCIEQIGSERKTSKDDVLGNERFHRTFETKKSYMYLYRTVLELILQNKMFAFLPRFIFIPLWYTVNFNIILPFTLIT